jgi:hypothetical protein
LLILEVRVVARCFHEDLLRTLAVVESLLGRLVLKTMNRMFIHKRYSSPSDLSDISLISPPGILATIVFSYGALRFETYILAWSWS